MNWSQFIRDAATVATAYNTYQTSKKLDTLNESLNDFKNQTSTDIFTQTKLPSMNDYFNFNFSDFSFDRFNFSFNIFKNNFNKMLGNDVIGNSIDNQLRETINDGRWDGIYHVNKDKNENKIYSIVKPKPITLNIDINEYPDSDYFKLPKTIREQIYNNSIITIPLWLNPATRHYSYKFKEAYYGDIKANRVEFPLFVDVAENYHTANDISLDEFTFTEGDNINKDVLASKMIKKTSNTIEYPMDYINNKIK